MTSRSGKSRNAFRTISEVADTLGMPQHVLRFWESKFSQISPMKRGGGRRYYRPEDVEIIEAIRKLLHEDGYTIKGAQKYLKEHGIKTVVSMDAPDEETSPVQNEYEAQILTITKKSLQNQEDEADMVASLKKIRDRLGHIQITLKE